MKINRYWVLAGLLILLAMVVVWRVARPTGAVAPIIKPAAAASSMHSPYEARKPKMMHATVGLAHVASAASTDVVSIPMTSLPPRNTPWAEVYAQLNGRAKRGDRRAATRLYDDLMRCNLYVGALLAAEKQAAKPMPAASIPDYRLKLTVQALDSVKGSLAAGESVCSAAQEKSLAAVTYEVVWNAARLGDQDAAACYAAGVTNPPSSMADDPVAHNRFRRRALALMRRGIKRGNWKMVDRWVGAYQQKSTYDVGWGAMLASADPAREYAYVRLQWIGAVSAGAKDDASTLSDALVQLGQNLSSNTIAKEDAWAQSVYNAYFINRPYVSQRSMTYCDPYGVKSPRP